VIDPLFFIGLFFVVYFSNLLASNSLVGVLLSLAVWFNTNINISIVGLVIITSILVDVFLKTRFNFMALRVIYFSIFWLILFKYLGYDVLNLFSVLFLFIWVFVIYIVRRLYISNDINGIFINRQF